MSIINKIKANKYTLLVLIGGTYLIVILTLTVYKNQLKPQLISVMPANLEREVNTDTDIKVEFNKPINVDSIQLTFNPQLSINSITSYENTITIETDLLETNTIYNVILHYNKDVIYTWEFATTDTSVLSLLGYPIEYSEDNFDISIAGKGIIVYVRKEPYETNKDKAKQYLQEVIPNIEEYQVTWIAPIVDEKMTWEDIIGPSPDGAP